MCGVCREWGWGTEIDVSRHLPRLPHLRRFPTCPAFPACPSCPSCHPLATHFPGASGASGASGQEARTTLLGTPIWSQCIYVYAYIYIDIICIYTYISVYVCMHLHVYIHMGASTNQGPLFESHHNEDHGMLGSIWGPSTCTCMEVSKIGGPALASIYEGSKYFGSS